MKILVCDDNVADHVLFERVARKYIPHACIHYIFTMAEIISQLRNYPHRYEYIFIDDCLETGSGLDMLSMLDKSINGTKVYLLSGGDLDYLKAKAGNLAVDKLTGMISKDNLESALGGIFKGNNVGHGG